MNQRAFLTTISQYQNSVFCVQVWYLYIAFLHFLEVLLEFQHFIPLVPRGLKLFAVWAHKFFKALYTEEAAAAHHNPKHYTKFLQCTAEDLPIGLKWILKSSFCKCQRKTPMTEEKCTRGRIQRQAFWQNSAQVPKTLPQWYLCGSNKKNKCPSWLFFCCIRILES